MQHRADMVTVESGNSRRIRRSASEPRSKNVAAAVCSLRVLRWGHFLFTPISWGLEVAVKPGSPAPEFTSGVLAFLHYATTVVQRRRTPEVNSGAGDPHAAELRRPYWTTK